MSKDTDASGSGNGSPTSEGGETDARKEARKAFEERQKIIKEAQEKHGSEDNDGL